MSDMLKKLKAYLESEEGKKSTDEYFKKIALEEKIRKRRLSKLKNYLETNSFDDLMDRMLKENGEEWVDKCYSKGYEPYPTNLLSLIIDLIMEREQEESYILEDMVFLSGEWIYNGYAVQLFCGQGCFYRILKLNNNKEWEFFLQV